MAKIGYISENSDLSDGLLYILLVSKWKKGQQEERYECSIPSGFSSLVFSRPFVSRHVCLASLPLAINPSINNRQQTQRKQVQPKGRRSVSLEALRGSSCKPG